MRRDRLAMALFSNGRPEQSLFWMDERTGVHRRARLDWLPHAKDGRMVIGDYKTAVSAAPSKFEKSLADFGYHIQHANYQDAVRAVGLAEDVAMVFVVQEKTAPYLVSVFEPDANALRIGRYLNRQAISIFAECTATDVWPGHTDGVTPISLPRWYERQFEDVLS